MKEEICEMFGIDAILGHVDWTPDAASILRNVVAQAYNMECLFLYSHVVL